MKANTILLMGRPASGKGTQAEMLANTIHAKILSLGTIYRQLVEEEQTPLALHYKEALNRGDLAPEWLAQHTVVDALIALAEDEKIVLDSGCRIISEAKIFDEVNTWLGREYVVFDIVVSDEKAIERITARSTRADDNPAAIPNRLARYHTQTRESIEFFKEKGKLVEINGEQSPEEVQRDILKALDIVT